MLQKISLTAILILFINNHVYGQVIFENNKCYVPEYACPLIKNIDKYKKTQPKLVRVLSIDGGGIRGIIPAKILEEIENRSGKHISELFDIIVGNSTGGIIALALNTPDETGKKPKYKAKDILEIYTEESKKVFSRSLIRKLYTGWGLWSPKYDRKLYDEMLVKFFGNAKMSELLNPTSVISYDINVSLPHIWAREYARAKPYRNFYIRDIAGATSAAPTYFAPKMLVDDTGYVEYQVDGGIYANNPQALAATLAYEIYGDKVARDDILIISLGTGRSTLDLRGKELSTAGVIGWVMQANLIDIMIDAGSEWDESRTSHAYINDCRFQIELEQGISNLDDVSDNNLKFLLDLSDEYIKCNSDLINDLVELLVNCKRYKT